MPPVISLLIPCYNAERLLPELLGDARAQSHPFSEIICFDDGSTDRTSDIARAHGCTVLRSDGNRGPAHARNRLLAAATSDWVHFHDADDRLRPNFVEAFAKKLVTSKAPDAWFCALRRLNWETNHEDEVRHHGDGLDTDWIQFHLTSFLSHIQIVFPRSAVLSAGGYDEALRSGEDVNLHIRLAAAGMRFRYLDEVLAIQVYGRSDSLSSSTSPERRFTDTLRSCESLETVLPAPYRRYVTPCATDLAVHFSSLRRRDEMERAIALALRVSSPDRPLPSRPALRHVSRVLGFKAACRIRFWAVSRRPRTKAGGIPAELRSPDRAPGSASLPARPPISQSPPMQDPVPETTPSPRLSWRHRLLVACHRRPALRSRPSLVSALSRALGVDRVKAEVTPGVTMELDPDDYVDRMILWHGCYEATTLQLFDRLLTGAEGFLDIGAHHGQYTLRAARALVGTGRPVVAVEPSPANGARLLSNASLSRLENIRLLAFALSDNEGVLPLAQPLATNTGGTRLAPSGSNGSTGPTMLVSVHAFPSLGEAIPEAALDLVKIDVEGQEARILSSLFASRTKRPRNILFEYLPEHFDYGPGTSLPEWLNRQGYRIRTVSGDDFTGQHPIPEDNLWASLGAS